MQVSCWCTVPLPGCDLWFFFSVKPCFFLLYLPPLTKTCTFLHTALSTRFRLMTQPVVTSPPCNFFPCFMSFLHLAFVLQASSTPAPPCPPSVSVLLCLEEEAQVLVPPANSSAWDQSRTHQRTRPLNACLPPLPPPPLPANRPLLTDWRSHSGRELLWLLSLSCGLYLMYNSLMVLWLCIPHMSLFL